MRWSRRHSSSQALALRSRIVLACADGRPNTKIADELGCDRVTVGKWRHRFAAERLEGLVDAPRPGAARTISDEVIEAVVVETLEATPKSRAQIPGIGEKLTDSAGVGLASFSPRPQRNVRGPLNRMSTQPPAAACRPWTACHLSPRGKAQLRVGRDRVTWCFVRSIF